LSLSNNHESIILSHSSSIDNKASKPELSKRYFYPPPGIVVHSGYSMEWGQWGVFLGGIDCHIGKGHCQHDGQAGVVIGLGSTTKFIGVEIIPRVTSINWQDGGFLDRSTISFKLSHNFEKHHLSVAFGMREAVGFGGFDVGLLKTAYVSITKSLSLTPKSASQLMALFTIGAGNGFYSVGPYWDQNLYKKLRSAHKKILPYFSIGLQLNKNIAITIEDYNKGIVDAALTAQPLLKWPIKITLGVGDIFTYMTNQDRPTLIGSIILTEHFI